MKAHVMNLSSILLHMQTHSTEKHSNWSSQKESSNILCKHEYWQWRSNPNRCSGIHIHWVLQHMIVLLPVGILTLQYSHFVIRIFCVLLLSWNSWRKGGWSGINNLPSYFQYFCTLLWRKLKCFVTHATVKTELSVQGHY